MAEIRSDPPGSRPLGPPRHDAIARPAAANGRLPRLCFVAPEAWPVLAGDTGIAVVGGAEVQQVILARLLAAAGYPVSMVCLDYGQPDRCERHGVTVHRAYRPAAGLPLARFLHPRLTSLWRAMQAADADIYYQRTAGMLTGLVAAFGARHHRRTVYAGASDPDFIRGQEDIRYRRDRWLYRRGLARVDRLVAQNEMQQLSCRQYYGRDATLIRSCYEPPADARPGQDDAVLWVGVLRRDKRPELFLELARRLPHRRFVMVGGPGKGTGEAAYGEAVLRAGRAVPNLHCTGFLPLAEVEPWFDRAAMLVNTSSHEGMPNTFLQAWARGVPTLALVDVGARHDGQALYPAAADLAELAGEIERLYADELHRRRLAERCRDYFRRTHSPAGVLAQYGALFAGLWP